jgi:hypothetical protein
MPIYKEIQVDLDYDFYIKQDYDGNKGQSCIAHHRVELKDIHDRFGGMPETYTYDNTEISQLWWNEDQVDYDDLGKKLGMEVVTVSSIRLRPGNIIPLHRDMFYQIKKRFPDDTRPRVRANINLEEWKNGHFIQVNHKGVPKVCSGWKQGSGHLWCTEIEHIGANCGMENKFSLQVSGFAQES